MRRHLTRFSQLAIDFGVLFAAFGIAFLMRFDWRPPADMVGRLLLTAPYVILFEYAVLMAFGIPKFSWRYIGLREAARIFLACVCFSLFLLASRIVIGQLDETFPYLRHGLVPFGVIAANLILAAMGILGARAGRRLIGERADARRPSREKTGDAVRTMLVGAGQAGVLVAKELAGRPELGLKPVGFLDDDLMKKGTVIHGIPVLGTTHDLSAQVEAHDASQVLITMANVPGEAIRRIRQLCEKADVAVKIIPGIYEIVGGRVNLQSIRSVAIEDLLRRDPVALDEGAISEFLADRVVLVTGAGGSIGSELCRQICQFGPRQLILVEQAENALFEIHRELRGTHDVEVVPCIGDVVDAERVKKIFARFRPSAVFHAAAHKHVPMMEWNPGEAVKNNVLGTKTVADASHAFGCDAFVMVSTDKAVNPTSVMGTTKRVAEIYVQSLGRRSETRFSTVRFGNVLGSNGSVVPIFKQQIAAGGPITVTHPDMTRYFMTIPEACQLVLQAGTMGDGSEIFILDMGEPVRIVDLARDLISLSGLREGEDIEIVFSGTRPGEKLFEELATDSEAADKTKHPKIFVGRTREATAAEVNQSIDEVIRATERDEDAILSALHAMVPEFRAPEADSPAAESAPRELVALNEDAAQA